MAEKALTAVIQQAYVQGISTRSVDDPVKAMGASGVSKSQVCRLCEEIDGKVKAFLEQRIEGDWPYLWIDAIYLKVRHGGRIVSVAVIIAVGVANVAMRTEIRRQDKPNGFGLIWRRLRLVGDECPLGRLKFHGPLSRFRDKAGSGIAVRLSKGINLTQNIFGERDVHADSFLGLGLDRNQDCNPVSISGVGHDIFQAGRFWDGLAIFHKPFNVEGKGFLSHSASVI